MGKHIVIIGLGTGGFFAMKAAMRTNRSVEVTVVERRSYDMFSPCGLPFAIEYGIELDALKHKVPDMPRLKKLLSHEVVRLDTAHKRLVVKDLGTNEESELPYDALLIATGSKPRILPVPGARELLGRGVYVVTTIEETHELCKHLPKIRAMQSIARRSIKNAVVVGGGGIGLELAMALSRYMNVHVTKRTPPPLPRNLDPDMGALVAEHLEAQGLHLHFGKSIDRINGSDRVTSVEIGGETIDTDMVLMSVGAEPDVELARAAGIAIGENGIRVNARMETSVKDVYAIGDCIETFCGVSGKPTTMRLATAAYRQAVVAGTNAADGVKRYEGAFGTFVSVIGELEVASTGLTSEAAKAGGFDIISAKAKGSTKPEFMPGTKGLALKLVADKSGKLLGAQGIGKGSGWRINLVALALRAKLSLEEFAGTELCYSPPVSNVYDVLDLCCDNLMRRSARAAH